LRIHVTRTYFMIRRTKPMLTNRTYHAQREESPETKDDTVAPSFIEGRCDRHVCTDTEDGIGVHEYGTGPRYSSFGKEVACTYHRWLKKCLRLRRLAGGVGRKAIRPAV